MRHRSRRPLLDTLWRPRVALGLAALCVGGTGAALVVEKSADEHTAGAARAHHTASAAEPATTSPDRAGRPTRSGHRRHTAGATPSSPAPTPPATTDTPDDAPSPGPRRSSPVRTRLDVRAHTPSVPTPSASTSTPSPTGTPADSTAPDTTLATVSASGSSAVFALGSDGAATYQCSVDGGPYTACVPALTLTGLTPGWHTLAARAVDPAGNVDPSPASTRWHATGATLP
jgi:hypothetical protein